MSENNQPTGAHATPALQPNKQGYVAANGLRMYYEEYGAGQPLILLHGGTATVSSWVDHMPAFAQRFRVIAPDSRGHGKTDNPAGQLSYPQMADDVAAMIRELNLTAPLVLGFSDGAQIALELGMRHPGLARALVLGGAYYRFSQRYQSGLRQFGFAGPDAFDAERMQQTAADWVGYLRQEHAHDGDLDYWKQLMQQIAQLWWTPLDYTADDFRKVNVPTLILSGDREEACEVEQSVEMYQMIPNAELFIVPNAGHGESAAQVSNPIVIDFLIRHTGEEASNNDLR